MNPLNVYKKSDLLSLQAVAHVKKSGQHSPPAQHVEAVKADGVCEGQTLEHRSLNSINGLQTRTERIEKWGVDFQLEMLTDAQRAEATAGNDYRA